MKNLIRVSKFFLILVLVFGFTFLILNSKRKDASTNNFDTFAKCLTERGAKMFGAYWCLHCKNEKAAFGDSFKYINYVECTEQVNECIAAGITGYPTWVLSDGTKLVGEQGLEKLSKSAKCPL